MNNVLTTFTLDPFKDPFFADWNKMFGTVQPLTKQTYPPYNIVKINDDKAVMEFAVAGFSRKDIEITTDKNVLTIEGDKTETDKKEYLHKGIAARKFTRSFTLPEFYEVESAGYEDGILYIDLVRNIPEEKKPKSIKIK